MNDDGTVMRGPQLAAFAEREKLQRITIAELISYRQTRDKLIERSGEFPVESEIGTLTGYAFLTPFDSVYHVVHGRLARKREKSARLLLVCFCSRCRGKMDDQPIRLDLNARDVSMDETAVVDGLRGLEMVPNRFDDQRLDLTGSGSASGAR